MMPLWIFSQPYARERGTSLTYQGDTDGYLGKTTAKNRGFLNMNDSTPGETRLRSELTTSISMLERFGIIDFNGHCSTRLSDGRILINTGASVRSAITPSDFVIVEADGTVANNAPRPPAELPMHLAVYEAREDVQAVVHGHPKWSTLLSSTGTPYRVTMAQGALLGEVPAYPSPESINNPRSATSVASLLGSEHVSVLLRAHGFVVTGSDVLEVTVRAIYLELNSERQIEASAMGTPYVFTDSEIEACRKGLSKRGLLEKCWNYYLAKYQIPASV